MVKQRVITVLAGIALLLVVAGVSTIASDSLGLSVTTEAHACNVGGSGGGGC